MHPNSQYVCRFQCNPELAGMEVVRRTTILIFRTLRKEDAATDPGKQAECIGLYKTKGWIQLREPRRPSIGRNSKSSYCLDLGCVISLHNICPSTEVDSCHEGQQPPQLCVDNRNISIKEWAAKIWSANSESCHQ